MRWASSRSGSGEGVLQLEEQGENGRGKVIMLENIVVNLIEKDNLYYLKVTIGLEVPDSRVQREVEKRQAHLRDIVISTISGKKLNELDSLEERNALKLELLEKLSESILSNHRASQPGCIVTILCVSAWFRYGPF